MFERIQVTKLNDYIYLLDDHHEATGYLVLGTKKAAVIDTMNGVEDVKAVAKTITDLPLIVINTHGHPDHIYGNIFFEEAYMSPLDKEIAEEFIMNTEFVEHCKSLNRTMPPFIDIHGGDVIDLGGVSLEVIELPGHTPGGILLLNREDGTLFTGDSINWHTWMQLEHCLPMTVFLENLKLLEPMWKNVKQILHGHATGFDSPELLKYHEDAVREVVEGMTENDEDYVYFAGKVKAHPYKVEPMRIIYNPERKMDE